MKLHVLEYDTEMLTEASELALYYRILLRQKKEKKGEINKYDICKAYSVLSKSEKHIITNLIKDLLPPKYNTHVGIYLKAYLEEQGISHTKLANILDGYMNCSCKINDEELETQSLEQIKSKIQKLLVTSRPKEDNMILKLVADYFNVSIDVLLVGEGVRYSIDLEKLKEIVDAADKNVETFLEEHFTTDYIPKNEHKKKKEEKNEELYKKYIYQSAMVFAEIVEEQMSIDKHEILLEEKIWIEWDDMIFWEMFKKLTSKNKEIVLGVLNNIYLTKIMK